MTKYHHHSGSEDALVQFRRTPRGVGLRVSDHGPRIDGKSRKACSRGGVPESVFEECAVRNIGGSMQVYSDKNGGTSLVVVLPTCDQVEPIQTETTSKANKYPWQQVVLDAFKEGPLEFLPATVNAAEPAASARLCDSTPTDQDERIALRDALRSWQVLFPGRSQANEEHQEHEEIA